MLSQRKYLMSKRELSESLTCRRVGQVKIHIYL